MIVVSVAAVLAAIGGLAIRANRPIRIIDSPSGRQTLELLSSAKSVRIDVIWPPDRFNLGLGPTAKRDLVAWLSKAIRDQHPSKYEMSGSIKFDAPTNRDWWLFEISDYEMRLRDGRTYWRGLSSEEFQSIIRREAVSTDNRP